MNRNIGSEGILEKEEDDFAWDPVCIKIKAREVVLNLLLSCDATSENDKRSLLGVEIQTR